MNPHPHACKPNPASLQLLYFFVIMLGFLAAFSWQGHASGSGAKPMALEEYLHQVKQGHSGVRGATQTSQGAELRSTEGNLLLAPTVFATFQYSHDGKPPQIPIYSYDFQDSTFLQVGVSQLTNYGLQAKLYYSLLNINFTGFSSGFSGAPSSSGTAPNFNPGFNNATTLELTQSLWGNGFGRGTRANQEVLEAQALATSYLNRFGARSSLVEAENDYWRLATARQAIALTRDNLSRAQKNYEWSERRAHLQLADRSDALQAEAQLTLRKLDLQRTLDDERVAARAFNSARGIDSDVVNEPLPELTPELVARMEPPQRAPLRDDVRAAAEQQKASIASTKMSLERDSPTLDVFGSLSLNGKDSDSFANATAQSFSMVHPTAIAGLRVSAPLDFSVLKRARSGWNKEEQGAELTYQRKLFEQEQGWQDLNGRLSEAKRRLQLASSVEKVQQSKLFNERDRLRSGRSTAFQVLSFETDYAVAELSRIQSQSEVLGILTQMKLFGEDL